MIKKTKAKINKLRENTFTNKNNSKKDRARESERERGRSATKFPTNVIPVDNKN